jgi:tetratricopeptide (TPR) repeat protein
MQPGHVLARRYLIEREAGRGGMGCVYRARDEHTGAAVALKVLTGPSGVDRFEGEIQALMTLSHEAIVRYADHGTTPDGAPYLVTEWIEGGSLDDRLLERGLDLDETIALVRRLLEALTHLHGRGVVHRDVKPSNVMLPGGEPQAAKLVDFGLARVRGARALTGTGMRLGTTQYMAPEQVLSARHVDGRADVFALGCVMFECITGRRAFAGDDDVGVIARIVLDRAPRIRQFRADAPSALDDFVARLLSREVLKRPPSDEAQRELATLQNAVHGVSLAPRPTARVEPGPSQPTRFDSAEDAFALTDVDDRRAGSPGGATSSTPLPHMDGAFVGRERDVEHVRALLGGSRCRVTLWGPAGVGKTRLAVEAARDAQLGAAFAGLREARDGDAVVRALAAALRPAAPPAGTYDETLEAVARILRARGSLLVVLDGAEGLGDTLSAVITACHDVAPDTRFVVTSRDRPRGGVAVEVGPLAPEDGARLFCERVGPAAASFARTPAAMNSVHRIVRALEGMPLAIELAAGRIDVLGLDGLVQRLGKAIDAKMEAAARLSWDLLSEAERSVLAQCSVFRLPFGAHAAEAVVRPPSGGMTIDLLQSLRDKSLLASTAASEAASDAKLSMYAAIRDFASARLDELGMGEATRLRHAQYFVRVCAPLADEVAATGSVVSLRAVVGEADDLIAAFEHVLPRSGRLAVAAALALDPLLSTRGPFGRHVAMLDEVVGRAAHDPDVSPDLLARARQARGRLSRQRGRFAEARADFEHALAWADRKNDPRARASALLDLGVMHHAMHALDDARSCYEQALSPDGAEPDPYVEARALGNLGALHHDERRFDQAYGCYLEAIALFESLGDPRPVGLFLANLATLDHERGRLADARRRYTRALAHLGQAHDRRLVGITLGNLGMLDLEQGDAQAALSKQEEARALLAEVNDPRSEAIGLGRLGAALARLGRVEEATVAFVRGERSVARGDEAAREVVRLQRAFLDVASARTALRSQRTDEARAAVDAARARIEEARADRADGRGSVVDRSDDARTALRILLPLLHELDASLQGTGRAQ